MKDKIGIVTYYDAINEGAFLQAYCLSKFLETNFMKKVEFIKNDIIDTKRLQKKSLFSFRNPHALILNILRYTALRMAQKKHFSTGTVSEKYDLVVVGSDEMWNIRNIMFSNYNISGNINDTKHISYAVSMGGFTDELPDYIYQEINTFQAISVRDQNSYEVLKKKINRDFQVHLDPVFLYDISSKQPRILSKKYLMVYGLFTNSVEIESIKVLADKHNMEIISVDIFNKWCKNKAAASPFEFVGYLDNAVAVVTNMFHGTMLAVVRNKKLITLLTERRKLKIQYAANLLGFSGCCLESAEDKTILSLQMEKILLSELDYTAINNRIAYERKRAISYFSDVLQSL